MLFRSKQWLLNRWSQLKTVIAEALPIDFNAPILNEFNQQVPNANFPRKTIYAKDPTKEVCKGKLVTPTTTANTFNNVYAPDNCWKNEGRERYRKLDPDGKTYLNDDGTVKVKYSDSAYQYCPYVINVIGYLNAGDWDIGLHDATRVSNFAGLDPNDMFCWYRENTEVGAIFESFYHLSSDMLTAHRTQFPNSKDSNTGAYTYPNLWQFTPGWHDQGLATETPVPSSIPSWDGRNYLRDSDYYNKVRNEMFIKIKDYIDRGYVYWSPVNKNDFQLIKEIGRAHV